MVRSQQTEKQYHMVCPVCLTENTGLFLDETEGNMECIRCGATVQAVKIAGNRAIPLMAPEHFKAVMSFSMTGINCSCASDAKLWDSSQILKWTPC